LAQIKILQKKVLLAQQAYVKTVQKNTADSNNVTPMQELNLKEQLELEKKRGLESVRLAINNQKIADKNNYDNYIKENQGFF
jgi:hypothetical protein